jgi:hypothetical protein
MMDFIEETVIAACVIIFFIGVVMPLGTAICIRSWMVIWHLFGL